MCTTEESRVKEIKSNRDLFCWCCYWDRIAFRAAWFLCVSAADGVQSSADQRLERSNVSLFAAPPTAISVRHPPKTDNKTATTTKRAFDFAVLPFLFSSDTRNSSPTRDVETPSARSVCRRGLRVCSAAGWRSWVSALKNAFLLVYLTNKNNCSVDSAFISGYRICAMMAAVQCVSFWASWREASESFHWISEVLFAPNRVLIRELGGSERPTVSLSGFTGFSRNHSGPQGVSSTEIYGHHLGYCWAYVLGDP